LATTWMPWRSSFTERLRDPVAFTVVPLALAPKGPSRSVAS
jgi:hypothetical protein